MSLPPWLRALLPPDTARRWAQIGPVLPADALLVGGTALTVHLRHRVSRDLDFFVPGPFDPEALARDLGRLAPFAITGQDDATLNGVLGSTKVQVMDARSQDFLESPTVLAGVAVAGLGDILATKLKVIQDRGEHRDYFDLKAIEQRGGRMVEEGLLLFTRHYRLSHPDQAIYEVVRGLGYHDDLEADPAVPEDLAETTAYWRSRLPALIAALDRTATVIRHRNSPTPPPCEPTTGVAPAGPPDVVTVPGYRRADGTPVRGYTRRR